MSAGTLQAWPEEDRQAKCGKAVEFWDPTGRKWGDGATLQEKAKVTPGAEPLAQRAELQVQSGGGGQEATGDNALSSFTGPQLERNFPQGEPYTRFTYT